MIYASQLWSLAAAQHSLLLLVGLIIGTLLVARGADSSSDRQTRLRGASILFGCHALALMGAAAQRA